MGAGRLLPRFNDKHLSHQPRVQEAMQLDDAPGLDFMEEDRQDRLGGSSERMGGHSDRLGRPKRRR